MDESFRMYEIRVYRLLIYGRGVDYVHSSLYYLWSLCRLVYLDILLSFYS